MDTAKKKHSQERHCMNTDFTWQRNLAYALGRILVRVAFKSLFLIQYRAQRVVTASFKPIEVPFSILGETFGNLRTNMTWAKGNFLLNMLKVFNTWSIGNMYNMYSMS